MIKNYLYRDIESFQLNLDRSDKTLKTSLMTLMTDFTFEVNHFFIRSTRAVAAEFHEEGYQTL